MEKKLAAEAKTNPNGIWRYAKSRTSCRSGVPDLDKGDGSKTKTDSEKAEVLNNFFKSVFTTEVTGPIPEMDDYSFSEAIQDISVTEENIEKLLEQLLRVGEIRSRTFSPR